MSRQRPDGGLKAHHPSIPSSTEAGSTSPAPLLTQDGVGGGRAIRKVGSESREKPTVRKALTVATRYKKTLDIVPMYKYYVPI